MKTYATQTLMNITQVNGGDMELSFPNNGKTKFYLDDSEVTCERFNEFFDAHDVGWGEHLDDDGVLHLVIYTDDAN